MLNKITLIFVLLITSISFSQDSEFNTYKNGLIYSEATMSKLSQIVDSLNLEYKICELDKVYYAKNQTIAHVITLNQGNILEAKKDLENQIDYKSFIKKYPKAITRKDVLIIKSKFTDYNDQEKVSFTEISLDDYELNINKPLAFYNLKTKESWVFEYNKKTNYSNQSIKALYFPDNFKSKQLDYDYARMIGYADCLIDTTAVKFKGNANRNSFDTNLDLPKNWKNLSNNKKKNLLEKLRGTKVYGTCSMDSSPRIHALNIAVLSAETINWEIFLRSHLDIMNDKFERVTDGSYAQKSRKTYIKEIESLNINVSDLIFGILLRVENSAENHYYGRINRLGRALSETDYKNEIEIGILSMIKDSNLDDYNRILSYYLFLNYNHHIDNKSIKELNKVKLKAAVNTLPEYVKSKISF